MTKQSYVEAVLAGLQPFTQLISEKGRGSLDINPHSSEASDTNQSILVKLLLSIDRREGPEAAMRTVRSREMR